MKKHGASHGLAILVCTVASALLVDLFRKHVPVLYDLSNRFTGLLVDALDLKTPPQYLSILVYAAVLAVVWGMAFSLLHSDRPRQERA